MGMQCIPITGDYKCLNHLQSPNHNQLLEKVMANARLHNSLSLSNHYRILELSIFGSKAIVELLRHIPLENYPITKLEDCFRVLDAHLDEAIQCVRQCSEAMREYSQSCNSDCDKAQHK